MRKPTYDFEVFDTDGKIVRRCSQSCHNIGAQERTFDLLRTTPGAVAVFGFEKRGRHVHSAYRY